MPLTLAFLLIQPAQVARPALLAPQWLPGSWKGSKDGTTIEEHWTKGESGLLGVFRMEKGAATVFLEAMVLEQDGGDMVLRIRHFGPGLKSAWEEKDSPVTFRLVASNDSEARFEGTGRWAGETLRYLRTGPAGLEVSLEKQVDGKPKRSIFQFIRVP